MIYLCKSCGAEIALSEINFEGESFCSCGGMELVFLRTDKNYKKKDALILILSGIRDHYK